MFVTFEGVDWSGLRAGLTGGSLRLRDGRRVAELFDTGWAEVRRTVAERLDEWQHIDEELLGPLTNGRWLNISAGMAVAGILAI